jgi:uncharacterized membrane protein YgdD (TMEM256/DUF423 family)
MFRNVRVAGQSPPPAQEFLVLQALDQKATPRWLPAFAAANAILALTFGTFAAHGIRDSQAREWIMTGVMFQLPHVAAVFGLLAWRQTKLVRSGAWIILVGAFIFASVLDALALHAPRGVAAFAPIGGSLMMIGWLWIGLVALGGDKLSRIEDQSR